ncbi:MAG: phosphotransferase [Holosporales bacterium]
MPQILDPNLHQKVETILQSHLGTQVRVIHHEILSEPERRNFIARLFLEGHTRYPSVILKQSLPSPKSDDEQEIVERFARDRAGIEFLSQVSGKTLNIPRFLGADRALRFILIEDLGALHVSLVDSLTGPNRDQAVGALQRFMKALAHLHAASFKKIDRYDAVLRGIHPDGRDDHSLHSGAYKQKIEDVKTACALMELNFAPGLEQEIVDIMDYNYGDENFLVLCHGDICPDNVFDDPASSRLSFIDFEWASPRSALRDAVYLRMGFPTCWCAKSLPRDVIDAMEAVYRRTLAETLPAALDDQLYAQAYLNACAFWVLKTFSLLETTWDTDDTWPSGPVPAESLWRPEQNFVRPRFVSRLSTYLQLTEVNNPYPLLRTLVDQMLEKAQKRWNNAPPLELYPAFR